MQRILLTGATGFLGSHLLKSFIAQGFEVTIIKRSTSDTWRISELLDRIQTYDVDQVPVSKILEEVKPDIVVHTACTYGRGGESLADIANTNLIFGLSLMEEAIRQGVKLFVNTDTLLPKEVNAYSLSKAQLAEWLFQFSDKIKVINLKIEHMYGPLDDSKKFVSWLINEMRNKEGVINLTSGIQKRDFIYIDDVVSAYNVAIENQNKLNGWTSLDVGTNTFIEVKEFILSLADILEEETAGKIVPRLKFGAIPYRDGDIMEPELDNTSLLALGWKPTIDYKKGLEQLVNKLK